MLIKIFHCKKINWATHTIAESLSQTTYAEHENWLLILPLPLLFNDKRSCCRGSCFGQHIDKRWMAKGTKKVAMASFAQ